MNIDESNLTYEYLIVNNLVENPLNNLFKVTNKEMEKNIGKEIAYKIPSCEYERGYFGRMFITGIQKDYAGNIIYRICGENEVHQIGRPANPESIIIFQ